jgi:hypothetical protein
LAATQTLSFADLNARDDEEFERRLGRAIEDAVMPAVQRVLRGKFRSGRSSGVDTESDADFENAVTDSLIAIVSRLRALRSDGEGSKIDNLASYAAAVASNAFVAFLKRKQPNRYLLMQEARTVLDEDDRLAYWDARALRCSGLAQWKGDAPALNERVRKMIDSPQAAESECFRGENSSGMLLPEWFVRLFGWTAVTVEFDQAVAFGYHCQGRREVETDSIDDDASGIELSGGGSAPDDEARARLLAKALWGELAQLSEQRRGVFLLFEPPGDRQDHPMLLLVRHQVADLEDIAEFVGLSVDRVVGLLREQRTTFEAVADAYGITSSQAEGIRKGVLELLLRRFEKNGLL